MTSRSARSLLGALLWLGASCSSATDVQVKPATIEPFPAHPGFDVGTYPGDGVLQAWRTSAPYEWMGVYLVSPCHKDASFSGRLPTIAGMGFGTAFLYVGQQTFEGQPFVSHGARAEVAAENMVTCSRTLLSTEQGKLDATDAVSRADLEGVPGGSVIFLDVEFMTTIPQSMLDYYASWLQAIVENGKYRAGAYVHRSNAVQLRDVALARYALLRRTDEPEFWVATWNNFSLWSRPADVGLEWADAWQGTGDSARQYAGVTVRVDESVARRASPSAPLP
ncbi:MAG: hypothetical protein JWO05_728 [Gemmatimonadetes bacterium]|nr:hypothetical protein [Gemmatimonadota bacterium]